MSFELIAGMTFGFEFLTDEEDDMEFFILHFGIFRMMYML